MRSGRNKYFLFLNFLVLFFVLTATAQDFKWTIAAPESNTVIGNENLFASVSINESYNFDGEINVFLDQVRITPLLRVKGNRLSFVYESRLPDGEHRLEIRAMVKEPKRIESFSWSFFVNTREKKKEDTIRSTVTPPVQRERWTVSGTFFADNRNEFISGSGKALRQEPSYTRSAGLDMQIRYKNVTIPVKIFTTSDNRFTSQTQNYYQAGFRNKWLELEVGDMNPAIDKLVLAGVRLRGVRAMLRWKASSIQFFYGNMNDAYEGRLEKYVPGAGIVPTNLINDSMFIVSGTYRRKMMAMRLELGGRKGNVKVGLSALKAKDAMRSIRYGLQPKDNFVAGGDLIVRLFRKKVVFNGGIAASVITNDISYGIFDPEHFDSLYQISVHFNPQRFEKLIILNTSTVPISAGNRDFLSYYTQLSFANSFQSLNVEYRRNGSLYQSLGNPFLRNNYDGVSITERVNLLKRKVTASGNYQRFSVNQNAGFATRMQNNLFSGSVFVNPGDKLPNFFINYLQQNRDGRNIIKNIPSVEDRIKNLVFTTSMGIGGTRVRNNIRATFNYNGRDDRLRPATKTSMYNYLAGWDINIKTMYSLSADIGKLMIKDHSGNKISDLLSYSLFVQWQELNQKFYTSFGVSNNKIFSTLYAGASSRLALTARAGFKFLKDMRFDLEGSIQPYRDGLNPLNDFDEKYIYLKYTYNFSTKM